MQKRPYSQIAKKSLYSQIAKNSILLCHLWDTACSRVKQGKGGTPSLWSQVLSLGRGGTSSLVIGPVKVLSEVLPGEGERGYPSQVLRQGYLLPFSPDQNQDKGYPSLQTRTWGTFLPSAGTGTGGIPSPPPAHAMGRIRRGRYASCGHAGGLSCFQYLFSFYHISGTVE